MIDVLDQKLKVLEENEVLEKVESLTVRKGNSLIAKI